LVQIDQFVAALVGTWLRPAAGLHVVALRGADETREWDFHHLAALTVEHGLDPGLGPGLDSAGRHLFTGHATFPDLVQRLAAIVGLADQPGPAGRRLWLAPQTGRQLWAAAGEEGAPGARRVLARSDVDTATARSLARALEEPRAVTHIEAYRFPAATGRSRSMGSLRLVEGPAGYWAFSQPPPEVPEVPEAPEVPEVSAVSEVPDGPPADAVATGDGVDVRPLTASQVGGLLTAMAAALGWPLAPAVQPAPGAV
jgi:hypothetical protein